LTILPPKPGYLWFLIKFLPKYSVGSILQSGFKVDSCRSLVGIIYSQDYDGIWSSLSPWLSFLIKKDVLARCFRISMSCLGPRISPLSKQYKWPQPSLSILALTSFEPTIFFSIKLKKKIFFYIKLMFRYNIIPC